MAKWTEIKCHDCEGHGQRSSYTIDGGDFMGADECGTCNGSGRIFQSAGGVLAQWPGGPFVGRLSKAEMTADRR